MALDSVGIADGLVLDSYEIDRDKLKRLPPKDTSLSNFQLVDSLEQLKQEIAKLKPSGTCNGNAADATKLLLIPVNDSFDVKGAGKVVLGFIRQGTVKV